MPLYSYICSNCSHEWEELWSTFQEAEQLEPNLLCPKCQESGVKRKLGMPIVKFKGGGWTPNGGGNRNYNSTSSLREQAQNIESEAKKLKSEDLYGQMPKPKDLDKGN